MKCLIKKEKFWNYFLFLLGKSVQNLKVNYFGENWHFYSGLRKNHGEQM